MLIFIIHIHTLEANQILDFTHQRGESIDQTLTRFDIARHRAAQVGAGFTNFTHLCTILFRAIGVTPHQYQQLLPIPSLRPP